MPYIEDGLRKDLDEVGVTGLCQRMEILNVGNAAGGLAYITFRLMLAFVRAEKIRFWRLALAGGVVIFALLEFYRRVVAPYEDDKKAENGDVL